MLYDGEVITSMDNSIFYEVHDEIEGLDLVIDNLEFSVQDLEDLRLEIKKLSDHAPSNARVRLVLGKDTNDELLGTINISSYYFHHEKTFYASDHKTLMNDLIEDTYFTLKKWNKYRSLAME